MRLVPLKQWICDTCGEIIEKPEDGYVQFKRHENKEDDDFIIVHHLPASPRRDHNPLKGCYQYNSDLDLSSFLGEQGLSQLLSLIDPGEHNYAELKQPTTNNIRAWVDFVRRLQTPYYEEARMLWQKAKEDGFFDGANEVWPYLSETLKELIERHGDR